MRIGRGKAVNEREMVRALKRDGVYGSGGSRPVTRSTATIPRLSRREARMMSLDELLEYYALKRGKES